MDSTIGGLRCTYILIFLRKLPFRPDKIKEHFFLHFSYPAPNPLSHAYAYNHAVMPEYANAAAATPYLLRGVTPMVSSIPQPMPSGILHAPSPFAAPLVYYPYPVVNTIPSTRFVQHASIQQQLQQQYYWNVMEAAALTQQAETRQKGGAATNRLGDDS